MTNVDPNGRLDLRDMQQMLGSLAAPASETADTNEVTRVARTILLGFASFPRLADLYDAAGLRDMIADRCMGPLTMYLADELEPAERAEFEKLLANPLVHDVLAPVIAAWRAPDVQAEVTVEEVDEAFRRFKLKHPDVGL
jgi:hypothetical protein